MVSLDYLDNYPEVADEYLGKLLEILAYGFFACDDKWRFTYINSTAEQILGVISDEIIGKIHWDVFPLTQGTKLEKYYKKASAGTPVEFKYYYKPWGRWFHNRCFPRTGSGIGVFFRDITEHKKAEKALRESEERFRMLFEQAPMGIFMGDSNGAFLRVNRAFCSMTGYTREEFERMTYRDLTHHDDISKDTEIFLDLLSGINKTSISQKRYIRKNGGIFWARRTASPLRDNQGHLTQFVGIVEDITTQRETGEKLKRVNDLYRAVLEDQTELISRYKPDDGTYTFVNEIFCRFFGQSKAELMGHSWHPQANPEDVPMIEERISSLSQDNPVVTIENRVFDAKGEVRWMQFVNRAVLDEDGIVREIQSVGRDITELKQAEESLRESNERFSILVQSAGDAFYLADIYGRIRDVNPEAERQSGYTRKELLEMHVADIDINENHEMDIFIKPAKDEDTISFETQHRNKNKSVYPVEVRASPIKIKGEKFWLGLVRDITDRKKAEKFRADVESIIRHDIKTPLLSLYALAELAASGTLSQELLMHVPAIQRSIRQVIKLVDSSDKVVKMEKGEYIPLTSRCALKPIFENIRLSLNDQLEARNIRLDLTNSQQNIYGEEVLVEDMLQNLVKNAVEASPEGGRVMVTCWREQNLDHIDIHNMGTIPTAIRECFFNKYVTSGKRHGTGLGTYSAQLISKAHKGHIEFTTSEEQGTTVKVILPCPDTFFPDTERAPNVRA